ncbi:SMI1/KNR4 family protein [Sphingobium yanoikuyae]|uniref:SMI1/KNR4 family protein n=1 Tax=Sphingobium yanoikuyae TaxID=13690 RepID=UPI00345F0C7D
MTVDEFNASIDRALRLAPKWFCMSDPVASQAEINSVESDLGISLPDQLMHFWKKYGSGYFGQINICSARQDSDFSYRKSLLRDPSFFVVSDDETGAYYGYDISSKSEKDAIYFRDEDGSRHIISPTFFDFVLDFSLPEFCR